MKRLILGLLFLIGLLPYSVIGQPQIVSLKMLPKNPLNSDIVKVICHTSFDTDGARLDSSQVKINNAEITVSGLYYRNGSTSPSETIDTITIGKLSPGNYKLIYKLNVPTGQKDVDTIEFIVGINKIAEQERPILKIFPNPGNGQFTFSLPDSEKYSIGLVNALGQQVDKLELGGQSSYKITLNYPKGIYYICSTSEFNVKYFTIILID